MGCDISLLILTCTIALRSGTVRAICYSWDTGVPVSQHSEQISYTLDQQDLHQKYTASRASLSNQILLIKGTAKMTISLCYILSAGFSLHNFHPKKVLDDLITDVDAVVSFESFRALKLTLFESFRVLKYYDPI